MRAIVIRGGVAVFDHDLHDDHRKLMLGDLAEMGHTFSLVEGPHPVHQAGHHPGSSHAILHSGPHAAQPALGLDPAADAPAAPPKAPKAR